MLVKYTPTKYASPWRPCLTQRRGGGEGEWYLLDLCEICVGHKLLVDICLVYLFVVVKAMKTKYNVLESPVIRYKETSK